MTRNFKREKLGANKTQREISPNPDEVEDEVQEIHAPNKFETHSPPQHHIHIPFPLFTQKLSNKTPITNGQNGTTSLRKFIRVRLSPPNRPKEKLDKTYHEINENHAIPQALNSKSPRCIIHNLKIPSKEMVPLDIISLKGKKSPKITNFQPKLNEELWDAASKGDLIKITHLLDPYWFSK